MSDGKESQWHARATRVVVKVIAPIVCILSVLAACGGGSGAASNKAQATDRPQTSMSPEGGSNATRDVPDACALVSRAQIKSVTGTDPGDAKNTQIQEGATVKTCFYSTVTTFADLAANYGVVKRNMEEVGPGLESIEGVGDEAVWDPSDFTMAARGEGLVVSVVFAGQDGAAAHKEQGKKILTMMLGNA